MVLMVAVVRAPPHSKVSPARNSKRRRPAPPLPGDGGPLQYGGRLSSSRASSATTYHISEPPASPCGSPLGIAAPTGSPSKLRKPKPPILGDGDLL